MRTTATILDEIVRQKRRELQHLPPRPITPAILQEAVRDCGPRRHFLGALRQPRRPGRALIAEVKKASPSAGLIRADFDPVEIAGDYARGGADCLSVLTDETFFQGRLDYLRAIRAAVSLPLLRKDFVIDERQILEAIEWGADAVLLIVAILDDSQLRHFHELSTAADLAVLVEVHDESELDRALAAGARLIGVNNRDLKTFTVDLATTERLAAALQGRRSTGDVLLVAESGIHTQNDVERLARSGASAFLIGESLMRHADVAAKMRELVGPAD